MQLLRAIEHWSTVFLPKSQKYLLSSKNHQRCPLEFVKECLFPKKNHAAPLLTDMLYFTFVNMKWDFLHIEAQILVFYWNFSVRKLFDILNQLLKLVFFGNFSHLYHASILFLGSG